MHKMGEQKTRDVYIKPQTEIMGKNVAELHSIYDTKEF